MWLQPRQLLVTGCRPEPNPWAGRTRPGQSKSSMWRSQQFCALQLAACWLIAIPPPDLPLQGGLFQSIFAKPSRLLEGWAIVACRFVNSYFPASGSDATGRDQSRFVHHRKGRYLPEGVKVTKPDSLTCIGSIPWTQHPVIAGSKTTRRNREVRLSTMAGVHFR